MNKYWDRLTPMQIAVAIALSAAAVLLFFFGIGDAGTMLIAPAAAVTLEELSTEFATKSGELKGKADELGQMHTEIKAKMEGQETISKELKEAIDKALVNYNELKSNIGEVEQKLASRGNGQPEREKSWGEQFVEGEQFKSATSPGQRRGTISQEVKAVTSTAAGGLITSYRESSVESLVRERRVVRDLLRTIPIQTSSVDYAVQTTRTNLAAPVAESAAKPYSDYAWSSATAVVRTLAHLAKITRQAMDDAPRLIGEIDSEMRYGLGYVEERQFLYGSGVGQNLFGIIPQASAFALPAGFPTSAGYTRVDVLRVAMLQGSLALLPPDGIVLHEMDWAAIELTKTTDGAYLFANPQGSVESRMWGLPVVSTPAMIAGDFLVGAFKIGAVVYDRMGVEVLISTENVDDFEKNLATMRAEERVAIAVKRPGAFIKGTFTTAIDAINGP